MAPDTISTHMDEMTTITLTCECCHSKTEHDAIQTYNGKVLWEGIRNISGGFCSKFDGFTNRILPNRMLCECSGRHCIGCLKCENHGCVC